MPRRYFRVGARHLIGFGYFNAWPKVVAGELSALPILSVEVRPSRFDRGLNLWILGLLLTVTFGRRSGA